MHIYYIAKQKDGIEQLKAASLAAIMSTKIIPVEISKAINDVILRKSHGSSAKRQKLVHIMSLLERSNPTTCLHREKIEEYFSKLTHTPDHPPYASMIQRAITELNEQGGSSKETISKFIEAEYEDLPITHATHLIHHLQRLVTKGEIVRTSVNCYILSFENSNSLPETKKGDKHSRRSGRNKKSSRQQEFKGGQSKEEKNNEETQNWKQVQQKIIEKIEKQNQAEEQQIGSIGEHKQQWNDEMIEGQNEVEGVQLKVIGEQTEAEPDMEGLEEHDHLQKRQNQQQKELNLQESQVLSEQINVTVEENHQKEETNQDTKSCEAMEYQREEEDQDIEELYHIEQENKKLEEKSQENEVREKQAQLPDIRIEEMVEQVNSETQHSGINEEQKRLQRQKMEVCCQIIDLRNMLQQFLGKEMEDQAPVSSQNYARSQEEDLLGSSDLTKEEFMELLKMTHKVEGKLINIISSVNLEVSRNNNLMPKMGEQRELLGDQPQTLNPCTVSETEFASDLRPKQQQQLEICGEVQASECQPKIIFATVNLPTDSIQLERNHKTELPGQKRPPEVETATLEKLLEKQDKLIKLCNQQEAPKSQPMSMENSLDVPCDLTRDENQSAQLAIQRIEPVLEEDSLATEPNIKFSGEAAISKAETEKSYLDVFRELEQLPNSELFGLEKLPEFQLVTSSLTVPIELQELDLESQQQTTNNNEEGHKSKQPENLFEGRHMEHDATAVELISQTHQQMAEQSPPMQLQPLGWKAFASQVDTTTSVARQGDQTQQLWKQPPPRQLRPRGRRPSESEPVLTTFGADDDFTLTSLKLKLKQKSRPSIPRRPQEQPGNHHGHKNWLQTEPTTADSIIAAQQQSNWRLRQRQPQGQVSMQKNSEESWPFQQKQPQPLPRGRPPKLKSDKNSAKRQSMAFEHQHCQKNSQRRGRGRPPKPKVDAVSRCANLKI